jgi:hypothetical protein
MVFLRQALCEHLDDIWRLKLQAFKEIIVSLSALFLLDLDRLDRWAWLDIGLLLFRRSSRWGSITLGMDQRIGPRRSWLQ